MSESSVLEGIATNAAWDLIKWLVFIVCGGLVARFLRKRNIGIKEAIKRFKINHLQTYRENIYRVEHVIKTANDNKEYVHKIIENRLWYKSTSSKNYYPSSELYFYYQHPSGYTSLLDTIAEHTPDIKISDIDNDNNLEAQIYYKCGAHTTVLEVYRIFSTGGVEKLTYNTIGSDSNDIVLTPSDGKTPCMVQTSSLVGNSKLISETWKLEDEFKLEQRNENVIEQIATFRQ